MIVEALVTVVVVAAVAVDVMARDVVVKVKNRNWDICTARPPAVNTHYEESRDALDLPTWEGRRIRGDIITTKEATTAVTQHFFEVRRGSRPIGFILLEISQVRHTEGVRKYFLNNRTIHPKGK